MSWLKPRPTKILRLLIPLDEDGRSSRIRAGRCLTLLVFALVVPAANGREPVYGRKVMVVAQRMAADVGVSICAPVATR